MKALFIGDIVGGTGRKMVQDFLPAIKTKYEIDVTLINVENMAGGFGITPTTVAEMYQAGAQLLSGGNHSFDKKEGVGVLEDDPYIVRPANFPEGTPGRGWASYSLSADKKIALINIMGRTFMDPLDCPFKKVDEMILEAKKVTNNIIVDFHAEATSEKVAMGWHLNGRVSAMVGTHTHIQTADERVLSEGTAYISDLGMTGPYDSVIGMKKEPIIAKFINKRGRKFEAANQDPWLCGVVIDIDSASGKARSIERIRIERLNESTHP